MQHTRDTRRFTFPLYTGTLHRGMGTLDKLNLAQSWDGILLWGKGGPYGLI